VFWICSDSTALQAANHKLPCGSVSQHDRERIVMKASDHFHASKLLAVGVCFILPAISAAQQQRVPVAEQIGEAYGVDLFGRIEAIRYTFNIPELKLSRSWVWEPATDTVSYDGKGAGFPQIYTATWDGKTFSIVMSDVAVKLTGSDDWIKAQ
jgi:hypothetical protein